MGARSRLQRELDRAVVADGAPSAPNMVVSVFGDVIAPHGTDTAVSVGALARLLDGFGVNERLVRTTLSRLLSDDIVEVVACGRRSFYKIAAEATGLFADATERIYSLAAPPWDGCWTLVIFDNAEASGARAQWRAELTELGFGAITPTMLASAWAEPSIADACLEGDRRLGDDAIVTRTQLSGEVGDATDRRIAADIYPLAEMATACQELLDRFDGFDRGDIVTLEPADAFKLRILLVAEYRRIRLAYPSVPTEALPEGWVGHRVASLIAGLYADVAAASERFVVDILDGTDAVFTPPGMQPLSIDLTQRFGTSRLGLP